MPTKRSKSGSLLPPCLLCWFVLVLFAGCGGSPEKVYPVQGTVNLDGTPMIAGTVLFEPFEPGESGLRHAGRSTIDSEGHYSLTTFEKGDGAMVGRHHVMVIPMREWMGADRPSYVKEIPRDVPDKYTSPETTPLEFEVKPGENRYDIELSTKELSE
jgi:hypothetical protein